MDHLINTNPTLTEQVDELFAAWNKQDTPGCALTIVKDGKVVQKNGYGRAQLEYEIPNAPSTVFHIASVSKQFTAFAIHLLAQEDKLALEDEVRKYLPELHDFGQSIRVRHLLHHTSGLRDQWNLLLLAGWRMQDIITEEDILNLIWQQRDLNFRPGDEELYCNTGYTLLGVIVKRVSGMSLATFAAQRIFNPLSMNHTHFQEDYQTLVKDRAYSYDLQPEGGYKYVALSYSNVGATSLFSTAEDLARWDQNFYDGRVGGQALLAEMHKPGKLNSGQEINYASGLVLREYRGLKTTVHGGSDAGFRSILLRFPEERFSVILLSNAGDFNPHSLAHKVADIYLGSKLTPNEEKAAPKLAVEHTEIEVDPQILDGYVGDYEIGPGFVLAITKENDQLYSQATGKPKHPLFASSETVFFQKTADIQVTFEKREDGTAETVILHQNGRNLSGKRLPRVLLTAEYLQEYTGTFYSEELNVVYTVALRDRKFFLRFPRGEREMTMTVPDIFVAGFPTSTLRYTRDAAGACDGFTVDNGRVRHLRLVKVKIQPVAGSK